MVNSGKLTVIMNLFQDLMASISIGDSELNPGRCLAVKLYHFPSHRLNKTSGAMVNGKKAIEEKRRDFPQEYLIGIAAFHV